MASYYKASEAQDAMAVVAKWMSGNSKLRVNYHDGHRVDADIFAGIINVPRLACSNGLTEEALMLLRGRVYHEGGHILATRGLTKADWPSGALHQCFNAVEDQRMEREVGEKFPGAEMVFRLNADYYNRKIAGDVADGKVDAPLWEALVAMGFRSNGLDPRWRLSEKAQMYFDAGYDTYIGWKKCRNAKEALELAKKLRDVLRQAHEDWKEQQQQNQQEQGQGQPQQGQQGQKGQQGKQEKQEQGEQPEEQDGGQEAGEGGEQGEGEGQETSGASGDAFEDEDNGKKDEPKRGGKGADKEEDGDEEQDGEEQGKGAGADDEDAEEGDEEQGAGAGDDDADEDDKDGEGAAKDTDEEGDEDAEGEGDEDGDEDGEGDEADGADKDGEADGEEDGDDDGDDDGDEDGDEEGKGGEGDEGQGKGEKYDTDYETEEGKGGPAQPEETTDEALDREAKGKEMSEYQNDDIEQALDEIPASDAEYVSRRDLDEHMVVEGSEQDKETYKQNREDIGASVAAVVRAMEQALRARTRCRKDGYLRQGKIDPRRLVQIAKGLSKDVMFQSRPGIKMDTAVEIVIDESGSMSNYYDIRLVAMALCEALGQMNIDFELTGTTTKFSAGAYNMPAMNGMDRSNPIIYRHYKVFGEQWVRVCHRIAHSGAHSHNVDGEVVEYAAHRLMARPEPRKIVISISDGLPDAGHGNGTKMASNLRKACERARKAGVEVYGFGVGTDEPAQYYGKRFFVGLEVGDIGTVFARQVAAIIGGGRMTQA